MKALGKKRIKMTQRRGSYTKGKDAGGKGKRRT